MALPREQRVDWQEYRTWSDEQRWELIDGFPYLMAPAPRPLHQQLVASFHLAMAAALGRGRCRVYLSPLDVRLSDWDVVQPDLLVLCDPGQLLSTHVEGAPSLVVEILSPSSARHDRLRKLALYARHGIPEYWIVTPSPPLLEVLVLDAGSYRVAGVHAEVGRVVSPTLPGLDLDLAELFEPCDTSDLDEVREATPPCAAQPRT